MKVPTLLDDKNRVGALLLLVFSLAYLRHALAIPLDPAAAGDVFTAKTLPIGLGVATIALSLLQLLVPARPDQASRIGRAVAGFHWRPALWLILLMAVYTAVFDLLGFFVASVLFLLAGFFILGERRVPHSIAVSVGLVGFLWVMLTQVFGLYLDSGALLRLLMD